MSLSISPNFIATAFVSCSLRSEDKPFINLIERILEKHQIQPIGTVGRYTAAPENPAISMRNNINQADMVVIVATPRYLQYDLQTNQGNYGLSEMVHVETGIAFAYNKPVVLFVQEGTHVGNFLPNVTQYIVLNGQQTDLETKWTLINSLLYNASTIVQDFKNKKSNEEIGNIFKGALAIIGAAAVISKLAED